METIKDNVANSFAPENWTEENAKNKALLEGLRLSDDHLAVLHALQEYYSRHENKTN